MITCEAQGCISCENTEIDGKYITFFPFPEDTEQREQWLKSCQVNNIENDKPLYVCQLHFEETNFTDSKELKPSAIPTISNKAEDSQRKRKSDDTLEPASSKTLPVKKKKLDEDSCSIATPLYSPSAQLTHTMEEICAENKTDISFEREVSIDVKESPIIKPKLCQDVQTDKKTYRLTIRIDKICGKPGPRSKKLMALMQVNKGQQEFPTPLNNVDARDRSLQPINKKPACAKGGCKLRKSLYESQPAFQCEHCDKYYVMKKSDNQAEKDNSCTLPHKGFPSLQSLCLHAKAHFICDMCQTECNCQLTYDKHTKLHVSVDPLYPYKCHQCADVFETREDVRQHCSVVHPTIKLQNTILQVTASPIAAQLSQQQDYRCVSCNITFRNEQAYRNHVNSHRKKEGLRCSISDTNNIFPVPNPLTGSQIGILRAVKFSCTVCSMEFDNVGEVDKHTRTHLEEDIEDDRKCNICKKVFRTNAQLNEHLKNHLSRAHPCPLCSKAFINRTTLKIHLKTHGES